MAADPEVRSIGLPGDEDYPLKEALEDLADDASDAVKRLDNAGRDDRAIEQAVGRTLKRASQRIWSRRPAVETLVVRL